MKIERATFGKRIGIFALAAALFVAFFSVQVDHSGAATKKSTVAKLKPIQIGIINEQGGGSIGLPEYSQGMNAAARYIDNSLDGVNGHPLKLTVCSTDGTAATTQACAEKFVASKPLFVEMGLDSNMNVAYPLLQAAGIPVIGGSPSTAADSSATDARFFIGGTTAVVAGIGAYMLKFLPNAKNVGVIVFNAAAGQQAVPLIQDPLQAGGDKVEVETADVTSTDMLSPLTTLISDGAQAVVALITPAQCAELAQAAVSQNLTIPFVEQPGCYTPSTIATANGAQNGWITGFYGPIPVASSHNVQVQTFIKQSKKFYGAKANIDSYSEAGFSQTMTIYLNILQKIGYKHLKSSALIPKADQGTNHPIYLGGTYNCGADKTFISVCTFDTRWFKITDAKGDLSDTTNGAYVDALPTLQSLGLK